MADTTKLNKPKIKVEEIEETAEAEAETPKTETGDTTTVPKIASFSQLDSAPPAPPEEKGVTESEPEKSETLEPPKEKLTESTGEKEEEQISSDEVKEWLKDVRPDTTKENDKGRGPSSKIIVIIVVVLLVLGAIIGGALYFQKNVSEEQPPESTNSPETTPVVTPEPTAAEEEVDLTTLSVSVLNGSGTAGEAGKVKNLLVKGGFSADKITTGNADSYDFDETSVGVKGGLSTKVMDAVKTSLSDVYALTASEDELEENSSYDIVIIVGSKKAE
jgi:hypothetical protein